MASVEDFPIQTGVVVYYITRKTLCNSKTASAVQKDKQRNLPQSTLAVWKST